jgi:hypothetical protein
MFIGRLSRAQQPSPWVRRSSAVGFLWLSFTYINNTKAGEMSHELFPCYEDREDYR